MSFGKRTGGWGGVPGPRAEAPEQGSATKERVLEMCRSDESVRALVRGVVEMKVHARSGAQAYDAMQADRDIKSLGRLGLNVTEQVLESITIDEIPDGQ